MSWQLVCRYLSQFSERAPALTGRRIVSINKPAGGSRNKFEGAGDTFALGRLKVHGEFPERCFGEGSRPMLVTQTYLRPHPANGRLWQRVEERRKQERGPVDQAPPENPQPRRACAVENEIESWKLRVES